MRKSAAILLAVGLSVSAFAGTAEAASGHNSGGHASAAASGHSGGGGHFGGHGGGHGGHHGGGYGYGYGGLGLGLGLGALYYDGYANDYDYGGYGPVPHDYDDNYPDDSAPPADAGGHGTPPDVPGYWYHCDSPDGYYPYVGICAHPWQAVPAVPPPPQQPPSSDSRN